MVDEIPKDPLGGICFFDNAEAIIPQISQIRAPGVTLQKLIQIYAVLEDGEIVPRKFKELPKDAAVLGAGVNRKAYELIQKTYKGDAMRYTMANGPTNAPMPADFEAAQEIIVMAAIADLRAGSGVVAHPPTGQRVV